MNVNVQKSVIALTALICMTVLIALRSVPSELGLPIITMIVGYAIGNGIAAKSKTPVEPLFQRKPDADSDEESN